MDYTIELYNPRNTKELIERFHARTLANAVEKINNLFKQHNVDEALLNVPLMSNIRKLGETQAPGTPHYVRRRAEFIRFVKV